MQKYSQFKTVWNVWKRNTSVLVFSPGRPIDQYQSSMKCNENKALSRLVGPQLFIGYFTVSA